MKVNGIIAEYNPFHNGHLYQLQQSKQKTSADYTIVVMSGNFTQRGEAAFCEKHLRAKMALQNGADLVLELPAVYATSSAGEFAFGGVSILNDLGVVDTLSFGSECGDLDELIRIADVLAKESGEFQEQLQRYLTEGDPYPVARWKACSCCLQKESASVIELLSRPNNILALEYLQTLQNLHSSIQPYTTKRIESDYHSEYLGESISSATAIRKALSEGTNLHALERNMPQPSLALLSPSIGVEYQRLKDVLSAALFQKMYWEREEGFTDYLDVSTALSDRICSKILQYKDMESFAQQLKTKELTLARIRRSLLHIALNIKAREPFNKRNPPPVPYARVLGFRREAKPLLSAIKNHSSIPLITKPADAAGSLSGNALDWFLQDLRISQFYLNILYQANAGTALNEYTIPIVIL